MVRRAITLLSMVQKVGRRNFSVTSNSFSGHPIYYRTAPDPPGKLSTYLGNAAGAFMWWWILWHVYHEPEHIFGHYEYPDPSKWTNEELGIPPDSED